MFTIYFDGGSRGNPGISGCGAWCARDGDDVVFEKSLSLGVTTNNVAEWNGLILGLKTLEEYGILEGSDIQIKGDSMLVIKQIKGVYRVKKAHLKPLYNKAITLLRKTKSWDAQHIYRDENGAADRLANIAMDL